MSFEGLEQLQDSLEKLKAVHDAPVVVFNYRDVKIHLRDLDAEEDALANESAYAAVEEAVRANQGRPDKHNFSRSMKGTFKYQIAYVGVAIRKIEQKGQVVDVDVRPTDDIEVKGQKIQKFYYFQELVGAWGSSVPNMIYEYLAEVCQKREQEVSESLNVEEAEPTPSLEVGEESRFKEVKGDDAPLSHKEEADLEEQRLAMLHDKEKRGLT